MSGSTSFLVELSSAGVRRGDRWLVRGVDLAVRRGEIVTLIGPNGSGKSTTVKIALGVLNPTEGRTSRIAGLRVGYVPQKISIDWTMPLAVDRFMRLTTPISDAELTEALTETGTEHLIRAEVRNLSGGEFQRVMLARALARKPQLLVLDEPAQGVDVTGEAALYELIRTARDRLNCGVLLVSHDLHMVMAATDHVLCLNGHVCCQGSPSVVAANSEYNRLFGPKTAAALAVYRHDHDHTHLPDGRVRHADGTVTDSCHPGDGHHGHEHGADRGHAGPRDDGDSAGAPGPAGLEVRTDAG